MIALVALSGEAHGFVVGQSDRGNPLYWPASCESVTIYMNGFSQMSTDDVAKSIAAAAYAWSPGAVACPAQGTVTPTHPSFEILTQVSPGGPSPGVAQDGKNTVYFELDPKKWIYPKDALAVANVSPQHDGEIFDVDIAINATDPTNISWANLDPGSPQAQHGILQYDLQTVMTHEFGHFLGLAHTCTGLPGSDMDVSASTVDNTGAPIPTCTDPPDSTNATQAQAVMWFEIAQQSITKRSLSNDDIAGACFIYPAGRNPGSCANNLPDDGCGCAIGRETNDEVTIISAIGAVLVLCARRTRRAIRRGNASLLPKATEGKKRRAMIRRMEAAEEPLGPSGQARRSHRGLDAADDVHEIATSRLRP